MDFTSGRLAFFSGSLAGQNADELKEYAPAPAGLSPADSV
jgi:hypothetical protein